MAQEMASRQLIWYDKDAAQAGFKWHCGDCGSVVRGTEGYDRHIACFPLHHLMADSDTLAPKSPAEGDAS